MKLTDLPIIAREMRAELPPVGRSERVLPNRLYIQLLRRDHVMQLVIARPDAYPDHRDVQLIGAAFGVDETSEPKVCTPRIYGQDGRSVKLFGAAYAWREANGVAA